jgi:hypothetical protein
MPIRPIAPRSERGSLADIQAGDANNNLPATQEELDIKAKAEMALATHDNDALAEMGIIVMNGSYTDPVSLLRHRQYIKSIAEKCGSTINAFTAQLSTCFPDENIPSHNRKTALKQIISSQTILAEDEGIIRLAHQEAGQPKKQIRSFSRKPKKA